jgi:hypothetical protein
MSLFRCSGRTKVSFQVRGFVCEYFVTKTRFHSEELLKPRQTPKLEDHTWSALRDCLFNIFTPTLHIGVPPSATRGRAMPWWQEPTCHMDLCTFTYHKVSHP